MFNCGHYDVMQRRLKRFLLKIQTVVLFGINILNNGVRQNAHYDL